MVYKNELIVFGGRRSDTEVKHIPKTFNIVNVNGSFEYKTYDEQVVRPNENPDIPVGVFLNDVQSYNISMWFCKTTICHIFSDLTYMLSHI